MSSDNFSTGPAFRWGVELTPDAPVARLGELAATAERAGFDAAFVSNHYNNRDPAVTLAELVASTESIRLGPGVVNPYEAHPVTIASTMATLAEHSGGRAILGIGAGDRSTLATLGLDQDRPVRRVHETIEVARALWAGERVDHEGTFTARAAGLSFDATTVPVYVGGQGPQMTRMAAAHADGLLANAAHPADYEWIARQVDAGRQRRAGDRGPFALAGFASVSVASTTEPAIQAARPPVAFIVAGAPDRVIDRHGLDPQRVGDVRAALESGDRDRAYELVSEPMIDAFCVAGTPAEVATRIETIGEHADAFVAASPLGPDRAAAIELLGEVRADLAQAGVFAG